VVAIAAATLFLAKYMVTHKQIDLTAIPEAQWDAIFFAVHTLETRNREAVRVEVIYGFDSPEKIDIYVDDTKF